LPDTDVVHVTGVSYLVVGVTGSQHPSDLTLGHRGVHQHVSVKGLGGDALQGVQRVSVYPPASMAFSVHDDYQGGP